MAKTHTAPALLCLWLPLFLLSEALLAQPVSAPQAQAVCDKPHALGTSSHRFRSSGHEREFLLVVPRTYDGATPLPIVLTFHGSGSDPEQQLALSALPSAADERGILVVAPRAASPWPSGGFTWNVPPDAEQPSDVVFVRDLLDDVAQKVCVDERRVYATGFSGGARLASQLGCELAERIAAVGAVGGLRHPPACSPSRPTPVVAFHGTADAINPYAGGGAAYWGYGVDEAVRGWAAQHGAAVAEESVVSASVTRLTYRGRGGDDGVVLYRIEGAGHVWPGTPLDLPVERLGQPAPDLDATAIMLDYFARHALP